MEQAPSKFSGFPEPKSNFTPIPNLFLDEVLSTLKEAELKVLLYIFRRTYGWQKEGDCISLSQFENGIVTRKGKRLDYGTGLARSTVNEALKSIVKKGYILRFIPGKGSQRRSHFFLNTEKNRQVVQALECGQLSIDLGVSRKSEPRLGRKFESSQTDSLGRNSEPTKKRTKKRVQKKGVCPYQNHKNPITEGDAVERLGEQLLTQKRLLEESSPPPIPSGNFFKTGNR